MTKLAVSILVQSVDQSLSQAAMAAEAGADLLEFRIDTLADEAEIRRLVDRSPLPCIVTCRAACEGGQCDATDSVRMQRLAAACGGPRRPAYIDVELAAYQRVAQVRESVDALVSAGDGGGLILSTHDFQTRPADLLQRVEAMARQPKCRVIKAAWHARSLRDNLEAFELLRASHKPTIALCMGEFGLPSRVLAKKFGALLTFAALDDKQATAPGQAAIGTMKNLYRWDALGPSTAVYGVIGWPVGHSRSPAIHNAGFTAVQHDGVYLPLPIPPEYEHFKATVGTWLDEPTLHFRGASVTIPHKQNLLRFVREEGGEIDPLAAAIGATNTLVRRADGSLLACNTDCDAILDSVCEALGVDRAGLAGRRVAVLGAGGAARAAVAGFRSCGAEVCIFNRTPRKAEQLAAEFGAAAQPWDSLAKLNAEIIINCTPIGMHPHVDASPLESWPASLGPESLVFDTVYNPVQTKLLQQAAAAGCRTVTGISMFIKQAAVQFTHWTGKPAPIEVFERIMVG